MKGAYIFGFITGLIIVFLIAAAVFMLMKNKNPGARVYDERQKAARGKAYQYAYITLAGYLFCTAALDMIWEIDWADAFTHAFIGLCLSFLVFVIVCIFNDAYISLKECPRQVITTIGAIGFANALLGIGAIIRGEAVSGGVLTFHSANLICAVMSFIVLGVYIPKTLADKKAQRDG